MSDAYAKTELTQAAPSGFPARLARDLWEESLLDDDITIFDVGCGTGDFGEALLYKTTKKSTLWLLDRSRMAIRGHLSDMFRYWDFGEVPVLLMGQADMVFCKSVIEHIGDQVGFIEKLAAMLADSGVLVVMAPDWHTTSAYFWDDPTHVHPVTEAGLVKAVEMAGLEVLWHGTMHQTDKRPGLLTWAYSKLVPQRLAVALERLTGNSWFRHAKQKAVFVVAQK